MKYCRILVAAAASFFAVACASLAAAPPAGALALPPSPGAPVASFDVGTLHVDRYGDGSRAVVLLPGLGCGPWEWFGVVPHLAASERVYVVGLPGFDGRAPAANPPAGAGTASVFASTERDLAALIAREGLVRPAIVGHSLGGAIAIGFAERYPRLARAIVSVDALPVTLALAYQPSKEFVAQADSAAANFAAIRDPVAARAFLMQNRGTTGVVDSGQMDAVVGKILASDRATETADLREFLETDLRPGLGTIVAPLLVVVPYYLPDNSTPPSVQPPIVFTQAQKVASYRAVMTGAPSATFVPIAPARHFVMLDAPAAFLAALDAFLAAHP